MLHSPPRGGHDSPAVATEDIQKKEDYFVRNSKSFWRNTLSSAVNETFCPPSLGLPLCYSSAIAAQRFAASDNQSPLPLRISSCIDSRAISQIPSPDLDPLSPCPTTPKDPAWNRRSAHAGTGTGLYPRRRFFGAYGTVRISWRITVRGSSAVVLLSNVDLVPLVIVFPSSLPLSAFPPSSFVCDPH